MTKLEARNIFAHRQCSTSPQSEPEPLTICHWDFGLLSPFIIRIASFKLALPAGLSPATRRFEAARSGTLSYGSNRNRERDAKAELNRRSQVCDALAGTGISRRGKVEFGYQQREIRQPLRFLVNVQLSAADSRRRKLIATFAGS